MNNSSTDRNSYRIQFGSVFFDEDGQSFKMENGEFIQLRAQSHSVFVYLAQRHGELISKDDLFQAVWGNISVTDDSLVQCVAEIRREIGDKNRKILQTVPRKGYRLIAEKVADTFTLEQNSKSGIVSFFQHRRVLLAIFTAALITLVGYLQLFSLNGNAFDKSGTPTLVTELVESGAQLTSAAIKIEDFVNVSLSKYRTVILRDKGPAEFLLRLKPTVHGDQLQNLVVELVDTSSSSVIFATHMGSPESTTSYAELGARVSASVASPGGGAIGRHLFSRSRSKPVEKLSRDECYAHGYGCPTCSGEEETITPRASACLAYWLEKDPADARAWALKSTILSRKHWFGVALDESEKNDPDLEQNLKKLAIEAANHAEQLSDGSDSAIYWGMAQAYVTSCQPEKLKTAIQRGLQINPDDPNLLASFGNWLVYSGYWKEGMDMTARAFEIEPTYYKSWWWYGIAKPQFIDGDYESALKSFMNSFNDRSWLSHLQLAYTLPYLGRVEDARIAIANLTELYPGFTREDAENFYRRFCFPDTYIDKMDKGLKMAGLASGKHPQ